VKPRRDIFGKVLAPGRAVLVPTGTALTGRHDDHDNSLAAIPVSPEFWDVLRPGMKLEVRDTRGARRTMLVVDVGTDTALVECERTTYLTSGMTLECAHPSGATGVIGELPKAAGWVSLSVGNIVELVGGDVEGEPLTGGRVRVGCTLPAAVSALARGHRVAFDDGQFVGIVDEVWNSSPGAPTAVVRITSAPIGGGKLKAEKGINLPDTDVPVAALTARDSEDLETVAELADIVALSFVRSADDVLVLLRALDQFGVADLGVVLKIETEQGFHSLPEILTTAMRAERVGVMIARGDLAIEVGYERLAEVQEEILWLCEAAHLPVIWATEVLDQLARTGRPSRSEITDAAMSERAECVMLNKGPHIVEAIITLDDILRRMTDHLSKKRSLMRPLRAWARPNLD
jgi:pyruvate kinase